MRTKTLLITAALGAAGIASSMAQQAVYSLNIVGYVNLPVNAGLSMVANQLDATPDNGVQGLFGTPPGSLTVNKFNPATGTYQQAIFDPDSGWADPTAMKLNPGDGAFLDNPNPTFTTTLVGQLN